MFLYGCISETPTDIPDGDNDLSIDSIFIGGNFTIPSNQSIRNIAVWKDSNWIALGSGISGQKADVECMAFYNNELYVGGIFDSAGGKEAKNIAKWDGKEWSSVGGGINGKVTSLKVYKDELYAGGWFSSSGGIKTDNIAKWNGTKWSSVGEGLSDEVYTLCIYKDELYAGGWFTNNSQGYFSANKIARWNGTNWDTVGGGIFGEVSGGGWVSSLSVFNNELYAIGNFNKCGNLTVGNIAKWNDSIWQSLDNTVLSNRIYASAVYKNQLHLAGQSTDSNDLPYYAIWNGSNWNFNNFSFDNCPNSLYSTGDFLYVGGLFNDVNGKTVNGIFKWDGTNIQNLGSGVQGYVSSILLK